MRSEVRSHSGKQLSSVITISISRGRFCNSEQLAPVVAIISDPGQDQDDEMTMVLLRALVEQGLVSCAGIVANLKPARARARLARGTLNELGLTEIPVGVGSDGGSDKHSDTFSESASSYMPTDESFGEADGMSLLLEIYESAPAASGVHLLLIASLKDAAEFVRIHEELFVRKVSAFGPWRFLPFE